MRMRLIKQTQPIGTAKQHVRVIRHQTRKNYTAQESIRIVISALWGEHSIAELYRRGHIGLPRVWWTPR
ncbi:MAG: hypothetical protein C6Y20_10415 [Tagaea sp. CACIAM 22H2]|nr:hypothetical protein [Tagaea sp. CACIAM 22H2]